MKSFYAYIRVSTQKQGEHGSSLQEQRDAIIRFAARSNIEVVTWFEETVTAAKQGRVQFERMMRQLKRGRADGVIFHKIDRGARNLRDWNDIQGLIEIGIDVRFAHESLDLQTRGGRLTADMLAVIASDYIRNLRDEVWKGIQGRLKQGIYPFAAPIGYLDCGGGKPKVPDPERAPFIILAFERYATGSVGIDGLVDELYARGFRTKSGRKVGPTTLAAILHRRFYAGVIETKDKTVLFQGKHAPLVTIDLFERVQAALAGKYSARAVKHNFLFRRMITCTGCGYSLIGETQKGHTYYRCHTRACTGVAIREDAVLEKVEHLLGLMILSNTEAGHLLKEANCLTMRWSEIHENEERSRALSLRQISDRLSRLTDALIDGMLDRDMYEQKKAELIVAKTKLEQRTDTHPGVFMNRTEKFLELAKTAQQSFAVANTNTKREILKIVTSNFSATGKDVAIEPRSPFRELILRPTVQSGPPNRNEPRTSVDAETVAAVLHALAQNLDSMS